MVTVNPLAPVLLRTIKRLRLARLILRRNRLRLLHQQELVDAAIITIHERDDAIEQLKIQNLALRAELRRYLQQQVSEAAS